MNVHMWLLLVIQHCLFGEIRAKYPRSYEGQIREYLLKHANYSSMERPITGAASTVHVTIALQIFSMLDLNERDQVITTSGWIYMRWRDERLSWIPQDFGNITVMPISINEIWTPMIFLSNTLDSQSLNIISPERGGVLLDSNGIVSLGTPLIMSTLCPLKVQYFPFDTQVCAFRFLPSNQYADILYLSTLPARDVSDISSLQWSITNITAHNWTLAFRDFSPSIPIANTSVGVFCLFLQREPSYYVKTLMVPSSLLCIISFVAFLAPPDSGERISLGVSMVLGLTVFQLLVADILPPYGDQSPILSLYLSLNFGLTCLAMPISVLNIYIAYGDRRLMFLKYPTLRKLFLQYLPKAVGVLSYSERVGNVQNENSRHRKELEDPKVKDGSTPHILPTDDSHVYISPVEQIKLEARIVALVSDRIMFAVFLVGFFILLTVILVKFNGNPEILSDYCKQE
ncbi:neuronal acetylcholine receptor subunit alpha-10-like [Apostichopus japonicus]|uniref:neuronal acetylcholine receptor subunit alpha-10-like n=1 Tax=Stichopus japonicus TaxID=307972 RepID=UPI003AB1C078